MSKLFKQSALSLAIKICRFGLGLVSAALLARIMSPHDYGIYAYALTIATLLAIPGEAGMPQLVIREVARARAAGDKDKIRGVVFFANSTVAALSLATVALAGLGILIFRDAMDAQLALVIGLVLISVFLGSLANVRGAILRGLGSPIVSQLPEQIIRPTTLVMLAVACLVAFSTITAVDSMIIFVLATAVSFVFGVIFLFRTYRREVGSGPRKVESGVWLQALLPFTAIAGIQVASGQAAALVLGFFVEPAEIGMFRIAVLCSDVLSFSVFALNAVLSPRIVALYHEDKTVELQRLVRWAARMNLAFGILVSIPLLVWGEAILALVFGPEYTAAYRPMQILMVGQLVTVSLGSVATLANMTGFERQTLVAAAIGLATNGILALALCPHIGAMGAAIAAAISTVLWKLILAANIFNKIKIKSWAV